MEAELIGKLDFDYFLRPSEYSSLDFDGDLFTVIFESALKYSDFLLLALLLVACLAALLCTVAPNSVSHFPYPFRDMMNRETPCSFLRKATDDKKN